MGADGTMESQPQRMVMVTVLVFALGVGTTAQSETQTSRRATFRYTTAAWTCVHLQQVIACALRRADRKDMLLVDYVALGDKNGS